MAPARTAADGRLPGKPCPPGVHRLQRPDTAWGFDYEPTPFVHVDDKVNLELAQRGAGCHGRDSPRLVELYQDPPGD